MAKRRNKNKKAGPVKIIRPADLNPSPAAEAPAIEAAAVEDIAAPVVDEASEAVGADETRIAQDEAAPEAADEVSEPLVAAAEAPSESTEASEAPEATEATEAAAPAEHEESPEPVEAGQSPEAVEAAAPVEPATAERDAEPLPEFEDASALLAQSVPVEAQHEVVSRQIESIPIETAEAADDAAAATADAVQAAEPQAEQRSGGGKNRKDRKLKLNKLQKHARSDLEPLSEVQPAVVPETEPEPEPAAPVEAERQGPSEPRIAAFAKLSEYQTLSLAHVAGIPEEADLPGHWRGVGFAISGRRLVTAFDEVVEIIRVPQITHVPGTQHWMLGVANVRGTLLPVVDLKQFLEGERTVMYEGQRVMVVRQSGGNVAVLIDQLYGQRAFNDSQKVAVDGDGGTRYGHFIKQFYRVGDYDWGVFSMSMLTRTPEFRQAAA